MADRERLRIIGGGPAGATAAIAAQRLGTEACIFEKSRFPRHKVCGEFLSPDAAPVLQELGILPGFLALNPFAVRRASINFGRTVKTWTLDEPAFGISRYALDHFLLKEAKSAGAEIRREACTLNAASPQVIATGRHGSAPAGNRQFGFKAHFTGPQSDSIDLLFSRGMYVGVNCVEDGFTNVCGLASEEMLRGVSWNPDKLIAANPAMRVRVAPLSRIMDWLITGPLIYGGDFETEQPAHTYLAGDALGFVDPFTGSGMLAAIITGYLAGCASAQGVSEKLYGRACKNVLRAQYATSSLLRRLVTLGIAERWSWAIPGRYLFQLTRPKVRHLLKKPGQLLGGK